MVYVYTMSSEAVQCIADASLLLYYQWYDTMCMCISLWSHLEKLYKAKENPGQGLHLLHKLKFKHVHLTSFSRMRVDLAAQVLVHSYDHIHCAHVVNFFKIHVSVILVFPSIYRYSVNQWLTPFTFMATLTPLRHSGLLEPSTSFLTLSMCAVRVNTSRKGRKT